MIRKIRTRTLCALALCTVLTAHPRIATAQGADPFDGLERGLRPTAKASPAPTLLGVAPSAAPSRPAAPPPSAAPSPGPVAPASPAAHPPQKPVLARTRLSDPELRLLKTCPEPIVRKFLVAWDRTTTDPAERTRLGAALASYGENRKLGIENFLVGMGAFAGAGLGAYATMGAAAAITAAAAFGGAAVLGGVGYAIFKEGRSRYARMKLDGELDRIIAGAPPRK